MTATIGGLVTYGRQEAIVSSDMLATKHVVVFGAGTVGSNAAVEAAKLGVGRFTLYDFDIVEGHNVPSQRYSRDAIGKQKVDELRNEILRVANDPVVVTHSMKVESPVIIQSGSTVILGVDSMASRKMIFERIISKSVIDGFFDWRMSGNLIHGYYTPDTSAANCQKYMTTMYSDEEADEVPCGGRTVSYTGAIIGGLQANYLRKHYNGESIPFSTQFDLQGMDLIA